MTTILDYQTRDLLFAHWLDRKTELLSESNQPGEWRGDDPLHRAIDARLDSFRPSRNPSLSCTIFADWRRENKSSASPEANVKIKPEISATELSLPDKREQLCRHIKGIVGNDASIEDIRMLVAMRSNTETEMAWRELNQNKIPA